MGGRCVVSVIGVVFLAIVAGPFSRPSQTDDKVVTKLQLRELLEGRVVLIGSLGKPIGEVVRVSGSWRERPFAKGSGHEFVVTKVNEMKLSEPVNFETHFVHAGDGRGNQLGGTPGEVWEMIAYEGIQLSNSEGLNAAMKRPVNQNPYEGLRGFISGVVVKSSKNSK